MEKKITADTLIMEAVELNPNAPEVLLGYGMHCLGCPHSRGESVAEACAVHGTDCDELVAKLNEYFGN